ncbi:MAG TPA: hypothetical protein VEL31_22505 [Ktedonobacteraceae bacterium]|nr:hypothetical protein [Ktedonobacteraceae bacterium]
MGKGEAQLPLPNVPFAVPELLAITSVISGYVAYLKSRSPSPDGERRIALLVAVRDRFQAAFASGDSEMQVPLNAEEVTELLEAMIGFVGQIKRIFPKNRERDQVVSTVNYWRLRLVSIIAEHTVD